MEWSRGRLASFTGGVLLLAVSLLGPLHELQFELLTAHLLQNIVLAEWAPALLVFGLPTALGERLDHGAKLHSARPGRSSAW